jgi:hypothetical protein
LAFDNDEACDWASDLDGVDDLSLIESAFVAVESSGDCLDAHDSCNALAACEVLARLRGIMVTRIPTPKVSTAGLKRISSTRHPGSWRGRNS